MCRGKYYTDDINFNDVKPIINNMRSNVNYYNHEGLIHTGYKLRNCSIYIDDELFDLVCVRPVDFGLRWFCAYFYNRKGIIMCFQFVLDVEISGYIDFDDLSDRINGIIADMKRYKAHSVIDGIHK